MVAITEREKLRRRQAVESVIGTNAMEGIFLEAPTLDLMRRFEEGEIEIEQLSAAIDLHVHGMTGPVRAAQIAVAVDAA